MTTQENKSDSSLDPYSKAKYDTISCTTKTYSRWLDPYSKAKYDTMPIIYTDTENELDPYSKAKYDTIYRFW